MINSNLPSDDDLNKLFSENESDQEKWATRGGIPADDLKVGSLITVLKNQAPLSSLIAKMGIDPRMLDSNHNPEEFGNSTKSSNNLISSLFKDYIGGGIVLKILAINFPYITVKAWDHILIDWIPKTLIRDIRVTSFIKVNSNFAQSLGIPINEIPE